MSPEMVSDICVNCNHTVSATIPLGSPYRLECPDCHAFLSERKGEGVVSPVRLKVRQGTPTVKKMSGPSDDRSMAEKKADLNVKNRGAADNWISDKAVFWGPGEVEEARRLLAW